MTQPAINLDSQPSMSEAAGMDEDYVSAERAASILGVSVSTLYAYVSRKGLRSQPLPGSRSHRYWRADIERLRKREGRPQSVDGELPSESRITLLTDKGPYYRGQSARDLAETNSIEAVAALLWDVEETEVFTSRAPRRPANFVALDALLSDELPVDRAIAHIPFLEHVNPQSFDLSPLGFARSGADIIRWLTAIFLHQTEPDVAPIHEQFRRVLKLDEPSTELIRRLLILSADHGFEESTYAVRAVASTGVTPWRAVATGLAIHFGRSSKFDHSVAVRRFVSEILEAQDPEEPINRRLREHEPIPGFESRFYANGDPRAAALLSYAEQVLPDDINFRRLRKALRYVHELQGTMPNFPLMTAFIAIKIGCMETLSNRNLSAAQSPFLIGRSIGWIAHACEQYGFGETKRHDVVYKGPLPTPP